VLRHDAEVYQVKQVLAIVLTPFKSDAQLVRADEEEERSFVPTTRWFNEQTELEQFG